jgi:hypothetical protein
MSKLRRTKAQVAKALTDCKGGVYAAARQLKVTPRTLYNYLDRWPELRDIIANERGLMLDHAEQKLVEAMQAGEAWAICMILKTLGKDRGYVERQQVKTEVSGPAGAPIQVNVAGRVDVVARIDAQLDDLRAAAERNLLERAGLDPADADHAEKLARSAADPDSPDPARPTPTTPAFPPGSTPANTPSAPAPSWLSRFRLGGANGHSPV